MTAEVLHCLIAPVGDDPDNDDHDIRAAPKLVSDELTMDDILAQWRAEAVPFVTSFVAHLRSQRTARKQRRESSHFITARAISNSLEMHGNPMFDTAAASRWARGQGDHGSGGGSGGSSGSVGRSGSGKGSFRGGGKDSGRGSVSAARSEDSEERRLTSREFLSTLAEEEGGGEGSEGGEDASIDGDDPLPSWQGVGEATEGIEMKTASVRKNTSRTPMHKSISVLAMEAEHHV